jgi:exopolyphosphatase/guanosine-5'-triphosphate,3'-diphosphate pyrophosphatase
MLLMRKDTNRSTLVWQPKKRHLQFRLSPEAEPLFGEVAEARLQSLASALQAELTVTQAR